ncbi:MAG: hypothetical protein QM703_18440 [Gemmatales bacterium]
MIKKLRRWHFDLAFFLGLAIFSWAYWYSKPRPVWTSYYTLKDNGARINYLNILGYSADSQSIYTTCETTAISKNWPIPQIQRWSTKTGELLEDYPAEFPEEDRFLLQLPRRHFGGSFTTILCADPRYFMVRYHQSNKKDHNYFRLYRIDGKPVGQGREVDRYDHIEFLTDPTGGDRHWITQFDLSSKKQDNPISVIDLDTGIPVRAPRVFTRASLDTFPVVHDGRHLIFKMKGTDTTPMQYEIIDLQTGESLGVISLTNRYDDLNIVDNTHYALKAMIGIPGNYSTQLHFFRYDPDSHSIKPDHATPLDGKMFAWMMEPFVQPPHLVVQTRSIELQHQHQIIQTILDWLARIGISRNNDRTTSYHIYDMNSGQLLRQVTGIPQQDQLHPSPDWSSLVTSASGPRNEQGLSLYMIPHYLWETTLSWLQWLSWLLVIPWPLRYFVQSHLAPGSSSRGAI